MEESLNTTKSSLIEEKPTKATPRLIVESWRGYEPDKNDWQCYKCVCDPNNLEPGDEEGPYPYDNRDGSANCGRCKQPRELDAEEIEQLKASERSGEEQYEKVILAEYDNNVDSLDRVESQAECLRQWDKRLTQSLYSPKDNKKFIMVALGREEDADTPFINQLIYLCKNSKTFTFPRMALNDITEEVIRQEFYDQTKDDGESMHGNWQYHQQG